MTKEKIDELIRKGPRERCQRCGLYFDMSELVVEPSGKLVHKRLVRRDFGTSIFRKGKDWERRGL